MSDSTKCSSDSRRRFLFRAGAAAVAAGAILPACGPGGMTGDGGAEGGSDAAMTGPRSTMVMASALAVGSQQIVGRGLNVVIVRDGMGYYAMSSLCTHELCPITLPASGGSSFGCSCAHGSTFSLNGELLTPSTTRPMPGQPGLDHYAVTFVDGVIFVDTSMPLADRTTRTPAPA